VLGSGWVLDFPLEEAYRVCNKIYLWDIHHPPQVLRKIREYPGIKPCYADITGGLIQEIYHFARNFRKGNRSAVLPDPENFRPDILPGSYCISLNVLNQLDILLVDYIKQFIDLPESDLDMFRESIQTVHLGLLSNNACFISDVEEIAENFDNEKQDSKNLVYTSIPGGKFRKEWSWEFDSSGFYHQNRVTKMRVVAISF
jgi:hypothetical protein